MQIQNSKFKIQNSGFVLPMSLIIISILVTMSATISMLIQNELEFSFLSRESQRSFFAADAGTECALFWDIREYAFSTSLSNYPKLISCASLNSIMPFAQDKTGDGYDDYWTFALEFDNGTCVEVSVDKTNGSATEILSFGYNMYDSVTINECKQPIGGFGRLVERALKVTY